MATGGGGIENYHYINWGRVMIQRDGRKFGPLGVLWMWDTFELWCLSATFGSLGELTICILLVSSRATVILFFVRPLTKCVFQKPCREASTPILRKYSHSRHPQKFFAIWDILNLRFLRIVYSLLLWVYILNRAKTAPLVNNGFAPNKLFP